MLFIILQWNLHNPTPLIAETFLLRTVTEERNVCLIRRIHSVLFISFSHAIGFCFDSDRLLCFPSACVGLIGPRPSDYAHALSACYYFLQAVFLPALGLWSSPPARRVNHDTSYSFLTLCFFLSTERIDESYIKAPTATSNWPTHHS